MQRKLHHKTMVVLFLLMTICIKSNQIKFPMVCKARIIRDICCFQFYIKRLGPDVDRP